MAPVAGDGLPERLDLFPQPALLHGLGEDVRELGEVRGLYEVIKYAAAHGGYRGIDCAVCSKEYDGDVGMVFADVFEELGAVAVGQLELRDHGVYVLLAD